MAKRVDQDATQDISASQLVPEARPPAKPPVSGKVPTNDASMWMQTPVSADDFMAGPKASRKPQAPSRGNRAVIVGLLAAAVVAAIGGGVWYAFLRQSPVATSGQSGSGSAGSAGSAVAAAPATPADASIDAAAVAVAADAGTDAAAAGALQADAISGLDTNPKKTATKKRTPAKKPVAKKSTATAPKKKTTKKH